MRRMTVTEALEGQIDRMMPALKYLAWSDEVKGTKAEIRELKRVIAGDFSEETKAYCRTLLTQMRERLTELNESRP